MMTFNFNFYEAGPMGSIPSSNPYYTYTLRGTTTEEDEVVVLTTDGSGVADENNSIIFQDNTANFLEFFGGAIVIVGTANSSGLTLKGMGRRVANAASTTYAEFAGSKFVVDGTGSLTGGNFTFEAETTLGGIKVSVVQAMADVTINWEVRVHVVTIANS